MAADEKARDAMSKSDRDDAKPRRLRPRPPMNDDTRFLWEGFKEGELRIQRCARCQKLRHPPGPACPQCHSFEWDYLVSSGRGHVYSYVNFYHPHVPPFGKPNLIVLIETEEGTRFVSNMVEIDPEEIEIGMAVEAVFTEVDPDLTLPLFRRAK
jgi:uncharacterized OB-fold protein